MFMAIEERLLVESYFLELVGFDSGRWTRLWSRRGDSEHSVFGSLYPVLAALIGGISLCLLQSVENWLEGKTCFSGEYWLKVEN